MSWSIKAAIASSSSSAAMVRMLTMAAVEKCTMTRMTASRAMVGRKSRAEKARSLVSKVKRSGRGFCLFFFALDAILFHPPVERPAAQAEGFCRLAHVPVGTLQGFADENTLNRLQAHLFEPRTDLSGDAGGAKAEIGSFNLAAAGHEHGAFNGVVELAHIARPGM